MRFCRLSELLLLALTACFFLASCASDPTLQDFGFVDAAERETDENPAVEPEVQSDEAPAAPKSQIPRTRAELAALLKELYLEQRSQELKISLLRDTLAQQQIELDVLQKNLAAAAPERAKPADSGRAAEDMPRPVTPVRSVDKSNTVAVEKTDSVAASERQAYNTAWGTLESGRAQAAETLFTNFLATYPKSSLIPNAEYWLGECFYSQGRYSDAVLAFQNVVAQYPDHHKAAASLLKVGYAYERLEDRQNAVFYLQQLVENYPGSEPAPLARAALNRLR
jgi:tol-pal system protein YbgF